jgi:hypothetical protein
MEAASDNVNKRDIKSYLRYPANVIIQLDYLGNQAIKVSNYLNLELIQLIMLGKAIALNSREWEKKTYSTMKECRAGNKWMCVQLVYTGN